MNLLLEECGYLTKNWFIWFKPACTAQWVNHSSIIWFKKPDEQSIDTCDEWNFQIVVAKPGSMIK